MEIYQGRIACEIIIGGIDTEVGIGNDRTRHIDEVNNLLEVGGRTVRSDVVNDEDWLGKRKAKHTAYLTKRINGSYDR